MFRLKIALLSALVSGAVLIVFGLFFLTVVNKVGMDRIDHEIMALGESQLYVVHSRNHWHDFDKSLYFIYGEEGSKDLIVHVTDVDNELLYISPHWPGEITVAAFPEFDFEMLAAPVAGLTGPLEQPAHMDRARMPLADKRNREMHPPHPDDDGYFLPPPLPPHLRDPLKIKKPFFQTLETPSGTWRTGIMGNQYITLMIGMDMAGFYEDANRYEKAFMFSVPLALLLMAGGGWLIAHRALKPIALITRTAESITARGLDQRIAVTGADSELLRLVNVINDMLDRLEKSFGQAVRFSADAAHELQTPLAILQGILDDAVQHTASGTDEQQRYSSLLEEVQRLKSIVQKLLILARADADQLSLSLRQVDMSVMVESAVEDAGVIGPDLNIEKHIQAEVMVMADPDLLRQVIQGLTANAVKYNIDEGLVRFGLTIQDNNALFTISNTGPLIPDEERERIFERFYRIDKSRSHRVPGTGLGLSLAREIVRAHKGEIHFAARNNLNTFSVSLPCLS